MKSSLIPLFCQCAIRDALSMEPAKRADMLELAAEMLRQNGQDELSEVACAAARDLRNAEASQLLFDKLINAASNMNKVQ